MFDVPLDAWYAWIGLALASVAVFGVVASLPTAPPPDAAGVADTVDRVAAAEYAATAEHPLDADAIRLRPRGVSLRSDAGTARASFAFGPVTPVPPGSDLEAVVHGTPPDRVFDSTDAFRQAVVDARARDPTWRPVERTLLVRRVSTGGYDVTLVAA